MSCIKQLAKIKDDKEYLLLSNYTALEETGEYKGYDYCITFQHMGFRCGYVAVPYSTYKNLLAHNKIDDFDVHGRITFQGHPHHFDKVDIFNCNDIWLGFDAGHSFDGPDFELVRKIFGRTCYNDEEIEESLSFLGEENRSKEYMIDECKRLIEQLIFE